MEKIYKTTGVISFYKMPIVNPSTAQMTIVNKIAVQFNIDSISLLVFLTCKGDGIKIPYSIKITPDHSDSVTCIYCGLLEPDRKRKEYKVKIEYSVRVILDIVESNREAYIPEEQKNILLKKL